MTEDLSEREGVPQLIHGLHSTYTNYHCRCDECREAHAFYHAERKIVQNQLMRYGLVHPPHGSASTYQNYSCRDDCPGNDAGVTCRQAASAQRVAYDRRKAAARKAAQHG